MSMLFSFRNQSWANDSASEVSVITETVHFEISDTVAFSIPEITKVAITNTIAYFERILSLCKLEWVRLAVLEGFVTTAGGEYEDQIQVSRAALINYASRLSDSELQFFCTYLVRILRNHSKNDRLLIPAMEVISFLFEAGLTIRLEQEGFGCILTSCPISASID